MDPQVHTDITGTFHLTPTGTGIKLRTGGIALDNSTPVAGRLTGVDGTITSTADLTLSLATQTAAATLAFPDLNGVNAGAVVASAVKFDVTDGHDAAVGTSTGTIELPAGAVILDVQIFSTVLWNSGDSDTMLVGDDDDPDGWFASVDLQASGSLLVGESLSAAASGDSTNKPGRSGGVTGDYCVEATGRFGRTTAGVDSGNYLGAATEVVGTVTSVGTVPTTGTTYLIVLWCVPTQTAATFAATE